MDLDYTKQLNDFQLLFECRSRIESISSLEIVVFEELDLWLTDPLVQVEELRRLLAGNGLLLECTGQCQLIEHCLVAAEERPVAHYWLAFGVGLRVTHVEHLTVVLDVRVIAIFRALESSVERALS